MSKLHAVQLEGSSSIILECEDGRLYLLQKSYNEGGWDHAWIELPSIPDAP